MVGTHVIAISLTAHYTNFFLFTHEDVSIVGVDLAFHSFCGAFPPFRVHLWLKCAHVWDTS